MHGEIVDLCPGSMIAVKWTMSENHPYIAGLTCQFTYELKLEGFRTRVTERVEMADFDDFRIRWAVKLMGWLTYRLRQLTGRSYLQRLKSVVEGSL